METNIKYHLTLNVSCSSKMTVCILHEGKSISFCFVSNGVYDWYISIASLQIELYILTTVWISLFSLFDMMHLMYRVCTCVGTNN